MIFSLDEAAIKVFMQTICDLSANVNYTSNGIFVCKYICCTLLWMI